MRQRRSKIIKSQPRAQRASRIALQRQATDREQENRAEAGNHQGAEAGDRQGAMGRDTERSLFIPGLTGF